MVEPFQLHPAYAREDLLQRHERRLQERQLDGFRVPRVSLLETEYLRTLIEAERHWLDEVVAGLRDGSIAWSREEFRAIAAQWT